MLIHASGRVLLWVAVVLPFIASCQTEAQRKAEENTRVEKQAAKEINRICALTQAQRETEVKRIKEQTGVVLYCGSN